MTLEKLQNQLARIQKRYGSPPFGDRELARTLSIAMYLIEFLEEHVRPSTDRACREIADQHWMRFIKNIEEM